MNPLSAMLELIDSAVSLCYTLARRYQFAAWARSRLGQGSKLAAPQLARVGGNVVFREYPWLDAKDEWRDRVPTLRIGEGTSIGRFAQINAWRSEAMGRNVLIFDRALLFSDADHNYSGPNTPICEQGDTFIDRDLARWLLDRYRCRYTSRRHGRS
jgi:hypothetical protein